MLEAQAAPVEVHRGQLVRLVEQGAQLQGDGLAVTPVVLEIDLFDGVLTR